MLIPSANNLAETIALWDAGSIPAFVAKMNARAAAMHLTHTRFADSSGASAASVSTPTDLLSLGMAAMQNPVLAQIVAMGQVTLPVAGTVYNVNALLGTDGIFGIKTGSGLNAGANFLFAANASIDGHVIVIYGCVMGQPSLDAAFTGARTLIAAMSSTLHVRRVLSRHQSVATYTTPWGEQTDLVSAVDVDLAEWPGMVLRQRLHARSLVIDKPLPPSTEEGIEHMVLGDYVLDVPLVTADQLYPPGRPDLLLAAQEVTKSGSTPSHPAWFASRQGRPSSPRRSQPPCSISTCVVESGSSRNTISTSVALAGSVAMCQR
jgi:D-alanyl-D-alanine carboxypeptidase (penicillin-binding protein 5/6)